MSDKVTMIALLTIPKRKMVAGEPYEATPQEAIDDEQLGRGRRKAAAAPVARASTPVKEK